MNIRRWWLRLASLFVACVLLGAAVPGVLAFMVVKSETIVNTFGAAYATPADATVSISLTKTMRNLGPVQVKPEGFRFLLETQDGTPVQVLTTDANGRAECRLTYTNEDLQTVHTYTLRELNDKQPGITYDDTVYTLTVSLDVNDANQIIASTFVDGTAAALDVTFENTSCIEPVVPLTGDDMNLMLCAALLLLSGTGIVCLLKRRHARVTK